jgi:hypothetical protein
VIHDFRLALQADEKERCFSSVCGPNGKVYRFQKLFRFITFSLKR